MPGRPKPGSARNRSGGIDLGAILLALGGAYGGVESNPDFETIQGPPTADGKMPGGEGPYKAKSFFDRNEASRLNAEYRAQQLGKDSEVARSLQTERQLNPVLADRERQVGGVKNENEASLLEKRKQIELKYKPEENKLALELELGKDASKMFQTNNIDPRNSAAQALYNEKVVPEILAALRSKYAADTQTNDLTGTKAFQDLGILKATAGDTASKALSDSKFGAQRSATMLQQEPRLTNNLLRESDQGPLLRESDLMRSRLFQVGEGSLFDDRTGTLRYDGTDPMKKALSNQISGGQSLPVAPQSQQSSRRFQDLTADDLIIDPVTKRILGVKPRQ